MVKNGIKIALTSLLLVTVSNGSESYGNVNGEEITKEEIAQVMGPQAMQFDKLDKNIIPMLPYLKYSHYFQVV